MSLAEEWTLAMAAEKDAPLKEPHKIVVANFPETWKNGPEECVRATFTSFGEIVGLAIKKDLYSKFATLSFGDPLDASKAITALDKSLQDEVAGGLFVRHHSLAIPELWRLREERVEEALCFEPAAISYAMIAKVPPNFSREDFGHEPTHVHMLPLRWHDKVRTCFVVFDSEEDLEAKMAELKTMQYTCFPLEHWLPKRVVRRAKKGLEAPREALEPKSAASASGEAKKVAEHSPAKKVAKKAGFVNPPRPMVSLCAPKARVNVQTSVVPKKPVLKVVKPKPDDPMFPAHPPTRILVPRGKAKMPISSSSSGKLPPPPKASPVRIVTLKPRRSVSPQPSSSSAKESSSSESSKCTSATGHGKWEEMLREAYHAEQKKDFVLAKKQYTRAVMILMNLKKQAPDKVGQERYKKLISANLSRAESAQKKAIQAGQIYASGRKRSRSRRSSSSR